MNMEEFPEWGAWLSPLPFLHEHVRILYQKDDQILKIPQIGGLEYVPGYVAAALVLTVLALMIYRKRDIESAEAVISIGWMRPLFRWCGGAAAAGTCTYMVWESLFLENCKDMFWIVLLCCGVAGIAGFFLCEMMVRKKFRVFTGKRIAESGVFLAVMVLCLVCMEKDVFGIERKLPKEKEIAGIYLDGSYRCYLMEASGIRQCLALHRSLIDAKEEYETYFKKYS